MNSTLFTPFSLWTLTRGRWILQFFGKPCLAFISQHITRSGKGFVLGKEVGTGRGNSDPVLTACHLVTDTEATSEEPISCCKYCLWRQWQAHCLSQEREILKLCDAVMKVKKKTHIYCYHTYIRYIYIALSSFKTCYNLYFYFYNGSNVNAVVHLDGKKIITQLCRSHQLCGALHHFSVYCFGLTTCTFTVLVHSQCSHSVAFGRCTLSAQ